MARPPTSGTIAGMTTSPAQTTAACAATAPRSGPRPLDPRSALPAHLAGALEVPAHLIDLDQVAADVAVLARLLGDTTLRYAVKAGPFPEVCRTVAEAGHSFEVASVREAQLLAGIGVDLAAVVCTNPIKAPAEIRTLLELGVATFAVDTVAEVDKLTRVCASTRNPPQVRLLLRVAVPSRTAMYDLGTKFGADPARSESIAERASTAGFPIGTVAFHVGSQETAVAAWAHAARSALDTVARLRQLGHPAATLDVGGGFPATYHGEQFDLSTAARLLLEAVDDAEMAVGLEAEPGRVLVAAAGRYIGRVLGVATRDGRRWVHLDVGMYHGPAEPSQSGWQVRYPLVVPGPARTLGPAVVTGPTCDSGDIIDPDGRLPTDLVEGEVVEVLCSGAYSAATATRFNGFAPPTVWFHQGGRVYAERDGDVELAGRR